MGPICASHAAIDGEPRIARGAAAARGRRARVLLGGRPVVGPTTRRGGARLAAARVGGLRRGGGEARDGGAVGGGDARDAAAGAARGARAAGPAAGAAGAEHGAALGHPGEAPREARAQRAGRLLRRVRLGVRDQQAVGGEHRRLEGAVLRGVPQVDRRFGGAGRPRRRRRRRVRRRQRRRQRPLRAAGGAVVGGRRRRGARALRQGEDVRAQPPDRRGAAVGEEGVDQGAELQARRRRRDAVHHPRLRGVVRAGEGRVGAERGGEGDERALHPGRDLRARRLLPLRRQRLHLARPAVPRQADAESPELEEGVQGGDRRPQLQDGDGEGGARPRVRDAGHPHLRLGQAPVHARRRRQLGGRVVGGTRRPVVRDAPHRTLGPPPLLSALTARPASVVPGSRPTSRAT